MPDEVQKITKDTTNNKWPYTITVTGSGYSQTHTFSTENKFLDADIVVKAYTAAAGALNFNITNITDSTILSMGSASSGKYYPSVALSATVQPASAGWITASEVTVNDNSVSLGYVNQSTLKNGTSAISSGNTVNPTNSSQTINISEGYNTARTVVVGPVSAGPKGTIKSGTATITTVTYSEGDNASIFTLTGSATVSAPTVSVAGYVSNDSNVTIGGTKQAYTNGATLNATVDKIIGSTSFTGTATYAPLIEKNSLPSGVIDASTTDAATTGSPTSSSTNAWVAVKSEANTGTLTATPSVTTDGYGTSSKHGIAGNSATVGAAESSITYVKIKSATIKSPDTTASFTGPTFQTGSTNTNKFTITASGTIGKPTVTAEGYIKQTDATTDKIGTRNTGSISGTKVLDRVTVGADIDGTTTLTHSLSKGTVGTNETWTNGASSGSTTTSPPSSGVYIKVSAAALSTTLTATGKVTAAGYGTTTYTTNNKQYIKAAGTAATVSASAANLYVPVQTASGFTLTVSNSTGISGSSTVSVGSKTNGNYPITANNLSVTGTLSASTPGWFSSQTKTDSDVDSCTVGVIPEATFTTVNGNQIKVNQSGYIPADTIIGTISTGSISATDTDPGNGYTELTSTSSPNVVIPSGGWLKITAGYYGNTKISLATLVPDGISGYTLATSQWIHPSYAAYGANGQEIKGSMTIYDGEYTVS